jgi:hypothetical protein
MIYVTFHIRNIIKVWVTPLEHQNSKQPLYAKIE